MGARSQGERRRKSRKRPLTLVYVELPAANGGMMRDLSAEGFAVRAMMPLRAGDKTPFTFFLTDSVKVEGEGIISWVRENGHVAGVQFTQISDSARAQIQEWLIRPEKPPSRQRTGEPAVPAQETTLEQLRQEMHSVPPRPVETSLIEMPVTTAVEESAPQMEAGPAPASAETVKPPEVPKETAIPPEQPVTPMHLPEAPLTNGTPAEAAAPPLPRLTLTPKAVEPRPHLEHATSVSPQEPPLANQPWKPIEFEKIPTEGAKAPEPEHPLPDISAILIQPQGKAQRPPQRTSPVETLASWEPNEVPEESWTNQLSLSGAVKVMMLLAMVVAVYVFHRNVGQGLIWLGEALGGVQTQPQQIQAPVTETPQSSTPHTQVPLVEGQATQDQSTVPAADGAASTMRMSSAPESSSRLPALLSGKANGSTTNNPGAAAYPPSPVSPLSGMTPSPANGNAEAGQSEYEQAMQILHGRNAKVDTPEALRLLWIAVEKGNANAELELADMYWRGRGVIQNCDQTLILLTAAARKGSAEAQKRLQQYRKQGCE